MFSLAAAAVEFQTEHLLIADHDEVYCSMDMSLRFFELTTSVTSHQLEEKLPTLHRSIITTVQYSGTVGGNHLNLGPVTVWLQGDGSLPRPKTNGLAALSICFLAYGAVFVTAFHCHRGWRNRTSLLRKFVEKVTGEWTLEPGRRGAETDQTCAGLKRDVVNKRAADPEWRKLLALFGLWLVTLFKLLVPTASWAKHFLVLVAMIGVFELCLLATIATLALLALVGLLAARLYLAAFGRAELFGLRRARIVGDQPNGLESQLLHSER
ncbi:hypothetical protein LTR95_010467 [Oleoguttula sp. CCFEE 5521]